ncbi:hypothetical protein V6N13_142697 [Hibiscus sabdariffa]
MERLLLAMSNEPGWINYRIASGSHSSHHIREDHNMIELVTSQCNAVLKPEVATAESYTKANLDNWYNFPFSISLSTSAPRIELIPPVSDSSSHLSLDGSYCGSSPSIEHPPFASDYTYISQDEQFKQLISAHYGAKRSRCSKNNENYEQPEKEKYHSKNLVMERNRRKKISELFLKLRALVPKISKMDRPAILTDAMEYIGDLQEEKKKLENELMEIEEENCKRSTSELRSEKLSLFRKDSISAVKPNQVSSGLTEMVKMEITEREFLIKLHYEHKRGSFAKLMEGIYSLGLQVIDANVTTFTDKALSIFKVELSKSSKGIEMAETKTLRKPIFTKVDQLRPGTSGHTLTVKVVNTKMVLQKGRPDGPHSHIQDETFVHSPSLMYFRPVSAIVSEPACLQIKIKKD